MSVRIRLAAIGFVGLSAAGLSVLVDAPRRTTDLIVLAAALVAGYIVELRPLGRSPLPIGFAVAVVLARAANFGEYALVVVAAAMLGVLLRRDLTGSRQRLFTLAEYILSGVICGAVFHAASRLGHHSESALPLLLALAAAALSELVVSDGAGAIRGQKLAPLSSRGADLALVSSGILMATGYGGISGKGSLGLWGPALFSIPLLAAWYSFELGDRTRRTFRQTVEALGVAPELGGLTPPGHVERVAVLAVAIAEMLGVGDGQLDDLETAAWLHHLGAVCLDDPESGGSRDPIEVARAGAEMLRASRALSDAGDIIAAGPSSAGAQTRGPSERVSAMGEILRLANDYDELTDGDPSRSHLAIDLLRKTSQYDQLAIEALDRVLDDTPNL